MKTRLLMALCGVAVTSSLLPWRGAVESPHPPPGVSFNRARLVAALGPLRLTGARLTGGLVYAPLEAESETVVEDRVYYTFLKLPEVPLTERQQQLVRLLTASTGREPEPRELADRAFAALLRTDWASRRQAPDLLEQAVAEAPDDAAILNDLAATYLEMSRPSIAPAPFLALSAALRARASDPNLVEARFNVALALEACGLFKKAESAWLEYLTIDPGTGWADEARQHLHRLRQPSNQLRWARKWRAKVLAGVDTIPPELQYAAHDELWTSLLEQWAQATARRDPTVAQASLREAILIARFLEQKFIDRSAMDAVSAVVQTRPIWKRRRLAAGFLSFAIAEKHFSNGSLGQARREYEQANQRLRGLPNSISPWVEVRLAEIDLEMAKPRSAWQRLRAIRRGIDLSRDPRLHSQQLWVEGLLHLSLGRLHSAALAFALFLDVPRVDPEARTRATVYLGRVVEGSADSAWWRPGPTMRYFQPNATLRQRFLLAAGNAASAAHFDPAVARLAAEEAWFLAGEMGTRRAQVEAGSWLGTFGISGPDRSSASGEIRTLTDALSFFERHDRSRLGMLLRLRAVARAREGDRKGQTADLLQALQLSLDPGTRVPYQGELFPLRRAAGHVLDDLVTLYLSEGKLKKALTYEEISRTAPTPQSLLDDKRPTFSAVRHFSLRPFSSDELRGDLPPFVSVVEYQARGNRLEAWVFQDGTTFHIKLPVTIETLRRHLPGLNLRGQSLPSPRFVSAELSTWLLQPIAQRLGRSGQIIFLLDPILEAVDFQQLRLYPSASTLEHEFDLVSVLKPRGISTSGLYERAAGLAVPLLKPFPYAFRPLGPIHLEQPFTAFQILRSLPKDTSLLEYSFLGETLVGWVVSGGRLRSFTCPISRREILALMARLRISADHGRTHSFEKRLEELSRVLLDAAERSLPDGGRLIVVPDEALTSVPFGALQLGPRGPRLVERYSLTLARSASDAIRQSPRGSGGLRPFRKVLVVENPIERVTKPGERQLSGAKRERDLLAHLFPSVQVVSGRQAVSSNAIVWEQYDLVHFGGHWGGPKPWGDPALQPDWLLSHPSCRFVVLAACNTTHRSYRYFEGASWALGSPLDYDMPSVLSSLWKIRDAETSQFLEIFYRELHKGASAAEALRGAQLRFLKGRTARMRSPLAWAAFQLSGTGGG